MTENICPYLEFVEKFFEKKMVAIVPWDREAVRHKIMDPLMNNMVI